MKYTVKMGCGHEDVVELFGPGAERERKIAWYESYGLCRECYRKKRQEEERAKGLILNVAVLQGINQKTGDIEVSLWFSGDTMSHKDEIKSIGYRWGECDAASADRLVWQKTVNLDSLDDEVKKAALIGAKSLIPESGIYATANFIMATEQRKKWQEIRAKKSAVEKPKVPEILSGHKWNQKVYGRPGNYSVYPDGEKVSISDAQAEEIREYLQEKAEYEKKLEDIENAEKPRRH